MDRSDRFLQKVSIALRMYVHMPSSLHLVLESLSMCIQFAVLTANSIPLHMPHAYAARVPNPE
jgi:hypothetical protein